MRSEHIRAATGVLSLILLGMASARAERPVYDIPRLDTISVDGKASDWGDDGFRVDLLAPPRGDLRPVADSDAKLRLGWNDRGLFALVAVADDMHVESPAQDRLWSADGVEVFLLPKVGDGKLCQWVIAPGLDPEQEALRWHFHDHRRKAELKKLPAELAAARVKSDDGYVLEMLLPWSALALEAETDLEFGLQLWVNDVDRRSQGPHRLAWFPRLGTAFSPSNAHRCRLANSPSPAELVRAALRCSLDERRIDIKLTARAEHDGKEVSLLEAGETLTTTTLKASASGHATADVQLAIEAGKSYGPVTIQTAGTTVGRPALDFPSASLRYMSAGRYRVMDAQFESVRVVLAQRGEKYSPAYIQGLSGSAFEIDGICPCAPTCHSAMEPEELVRLLGYDAERMGLDQKGMDPAKEVHKLVARVKDEIRAGRSVIVWHAFTTAEWDVVCGFDDEKRQFIGRGSYAGRERYAWASETRTANCLQICPALGAIFVGEKTGELNAREAELTALEQAVRHAHTPRDRFLTETADRKLPWRYRSGLGCYECWERNFRHDPKGAPSVGDRYCLGIYLSTHRMAAAFMRELAPKYPEAKEGFERAAQSFTKEADALGKLRKLEGMDWGSRSKPDPERNALAADMLKEAREAYAEGIDEIEQVLQSIDPDRAARARLPRPVRRENGRTWVERVKKLKFEDGRDCTFIGALEEALLATQRPYKYHDLMGLSGLAFRVRWGNEDTKTKWCGSCAIGEMPDEQALLPRLTGWSLPTQWIDAKKRDSEALRKRIVASINAGKPVVAYPPVWNMALIYGYEDGGRTVLVNA